jgi:hypothetical protein
VRYRIDGSGISFDRGLGFPDPPAASAALGQPAAGCGDDPRWQPSAFDRKNALWCMCGAGPTLRRCPGCCGPCPDCPPRKCQQQPYKVFQSNDVAAFDCKCGPCGAAPG